LTLIINKLIQRRGKNIKVQLTKDPSS